MAGHEYRPAMGPTGSAELCLDLEVLRSGQGAMKLEQRVARLFEANRDAVYRYVLTILGNTGESEEITQEAFIRLYRYLKAGHRVGHLRAWLFRVAHNLALNQQKARKFLDSSDSASWEELCRLQLDPEPNPEQRAARSEDYVRVRAAMAQLPTQQRQCVLLRAEGFRYREIAEILGVSSSTVAESLRRGMRKLRKCSDV